MANTLENTLNKVGNAIETILGSNSPKETSPTAVITGQTCLERFGMEARKEHLMRNEWKKDLQYTKALVNSEYEIQSEFIVSSYEDRLREKALNAAAVEADKTFKSQMAAEDKAAKKAEKKRKKEERLKKKQEGNKATNPDGTVEHYNEPQETITKVGGITPDNSAQYEAYLTNPYAVAMGGNPFNQ